MRFVYIENILMTGEKSAKNMVPFQHKSPTSFSRSEIASMEDRKSGAQGKQIKIIPRKCFIVGVLLAGYVYISSTLPWSPLVVHYLG